MPRNALVTVPTKVWTQLTDADVTNITFQNRGPFHVWIAVTSDATPPTNKDNAFLIGVNENGHAINEPLSNLMPGVVGARVWAYSDTTVARVMVSHA